MHVAIGVGSFVSLTLKCGQLAHTILASTNFLHSFLGVWLRQSLQTHSCASLVIITFRGTTL
jgi:hypothetical protein